MPDANPTEETRMEDLQLVALRAVRDHIVRHTIKQIDALDCDVSAIADHHATGYRSGFREAQRQATCALAEMLTAADCT